MNENLDLVEKLKGCLVGTKLYSSVYGEVELENVKDNTNYPIVVKIDELSTDSFTADGKLFKEYDGECALFPSKEQRDWSKFKPKKPKQPKFDPKTLQPFDKVLVRNESKYAWKCNLFSHIKHEIDEDYKYCTLCYGYIYCIPYNDDTKHLVGTTEEAPEYYRYWED